MCYDVLVNIRESQQMSKTYHCQLLILNPSCYDSRRACWAKRETFAIVERCGQTITVEPHPDFETITLHLVRFSGTRDECLKIRRELTTALRISSAGGIALRFSHT